MYNAPLGYEITNFSPGWDNIALPTKMDRGNFKEIKNFNISRHGGIKKRGGMIPLYASSAGSDKVTSLYEYNAPDGNAYLLTALGTKIRAFYEAAWHDLKTGLTADKKYSFATHLGLCYGVNGIDPNFKLYNNVPYQVGITPPVDAPGVLKIAAGEDTKVEEYAKTNQDNCGELLQHADRTRIAQGFKLNKDAELTKVKLCLKKIGTITAGKKVWVEIHSDQVGTQIPGDSDTKEANDIGISFEDIELTFSGTKPVLSKNTQYYMVIYGDYDVSSTNFIVVGFDNSDPSYVEGKYWEINGSSVWVDHSSIDLVFEIYGISTEETELASFGLLETGNDDPLRDVNEVYLLAQSFQITEESKITSVKLPLKKNMPGQAFNFWAEIHDSQDGTSGTKNTSARQVGEASDEVSGLDISYDYGWIEFVFSGTKPSLPFVATTVDQYSAVKDLYVASTVGFIVGGTVIIGKGTDREEIKVIDSIQEGVKLTMTENLEYTHTAEQEDPAENSYYIVLFSDHIPHETKFITWTKDTEGYSGGQRHWINSSMVWADQIYDQEDFSFKVFGYAVAGIKFTENALGYIDVIRSLRETTSQTLVAQSLEVTEESTVTKVKLWLSKVGSPTGNLWVEIHDGIENTSPNKNTSTYRVPEASANVDIATEVTGAFPTYGWVEFTFSGIKPPLHKDKTYYIVLYGSYDVSEETYVAVGMDKIDPQYTDGKKWDVASGSPMEWTSFDYVDLIFELYMTVGGLTGRYKHKYCYKRTIFKDLWSNPSEASDLTEPSAENMRVSLVHSDDPQVNKIILYRTKDMPEGDEEDPLYHKVEELENEDQDYDDALSDGALTTLLKEDNTIPPKAKFVTVHKDRVFYANFPDVEDGKTKVAWSKSGLGEAVPSLNYQHFDRDDGKEIMGMISLRDFLLVFKKDKIGVLAGDLSQPLSCELTYLSLGIGCIASWAILPLEDKVIFLSEEGWKATDGVNIFDISSKINGLIKDGYITINQNENYSIAYYPEKQQFQFLINHSTLDPIVAVGHFIIPLMLASKGIIGISEKALGSMVGWTPHQYESHTLTCLGNYTDSNGITRVIAGSNDGYIYLLDSGKSDNGANIHCKLRTDWLSLGRPKTHTKVTRRGRLAYGTDGTINLEFQEDIDFKAGGSPVIFTGAGRDIDDALNEPFNLAGTGELFRYTLSEIGSQELSINAIALQFRDIGAR